MPAVAKWIQLIMHVSVYYKLSLFNVLVLIMFVHIYMNKLFLNQKPLDSVHKTQQYYFWRERNAEAGNRTEVVRLPA